MPADRPNLSEDQRTEAIRYMILVVFQLLSPRLDTDVISMPDTTLEDINELNKVIVTGTDLSALFNVIGPYLPVDYCRLESITSNLIDNANVASAARFKHTYLPFIVHVLSEDISLFLTEAMTPTPTARHLVSTLLLRYVVGIIATEPAKAGSWCRSEVGRCSCVDCVRVNAILRSNKRVDGIKVSKARRQHLHRTFNDRNDGSYSIETIRTTNPNEFRITKNMGRWQKERNQWSRLVDEGKVWMSLLVSKGLIKEWFEHEEDFEDVIALNANVLKDRPKQRWQERINVNMARIDEDMEERRSALMKVSGNPLKRAAEGPDGEERQAKRNARGENVKQEVEVVDLTED